MQNSQNVKYRIDESHRQILVNMNGREVALPALWLRERCQDSDSLDSITKQRLFDPHQLDVDMSLIGVERKLMTSLPYRLMTAISESIT